MDEPCLSAEESGQTSVEWIGVMAVVVVIIGAVIALGAPMGREVLATFDVQACRVTNDCVGSSPGGNISTRIGTAGGAAAADNLDSGF